MWFDEGGALQVTDDVPSGAVVEGFERVPGLLEVVYSAASRTNGDRAVVGRGVRARARGARRAQEDLALRCGPVRPRRSPSSGAGRIRTFGGGMMA